MPPPNVLRISVANSLERSTGGSFFNVCFAFEVVDYRRALSTLLLGCTLLVSHDRIDLEVILMTFTIQYEREDDGRWLAEVLELPGVLAYGETSDEAIAKAQALALRTVADRLEHSESAAEFVNISFAAA